MPALVTSPFGQRFDAALLFADLTGFTALTERFAAQGPSGAEALARLLNICFGRLADEILAAGGDVLHFAGDAPIAVFPENAGEIPDAMARASACAARLHAAMPELSTLAGQTLSLRMALAYGPFAGLSAGAHAGRREFVVAGPAFAAIAPALSRAQPGETWLATNDGLSRVATAEPLASLARSARTEPAADLVRPFLSRSLMARLDAGQSDWIAEFRRVTTLFVTIHDAVDITEAGLARIDAVFSAMQGAVYAADGSINQFLVDDKGTTLVAAWGVPGRSHDNDATRASLAAIDIASALTAHRVSAGIGIATGRVFCGWRGNESRREFALIGRAVNLASRLSAHAAEVRADSATREAAGARVQWAPGPTLTVKGVDAPVATFTPIAAASTTATQAPTAGMVGRAAERERLAQAFIEVKAGRGGAIFVEGEPGTGKSTLLADAVERARGHGEQILTTAAAPMVRTGALDIWRDLLRQLIDSRGATAADALVQLQRHLEGVVALQDSLPLLASVLGAPLADNDFTAGLTGTIRAEATREAVVAVVQRAAHRRPLVIVVDDAQWLDSLSWSALAAVISREPRLLALVGHRPMAELPAEWALMTQQARAQLIKLDRLTDEEVAELTRRELRVTMLPGELRALVLGKTQGHPLFVSELVRWLRDTGAIVVTQQTCRLASKVEDLTAELPGTVEGVLLGRFDQLPAAPHLTLRVASVLGQTFSLDAITAIHPVDHDSASLAAQLDACEGQRFLTRSGDGAFAFAHALVHDVAYGLVVPTQRVAWHRATAEFLETVPGEERADAVLAFHWTRAEHFPRAVEYLERAGTEAAARGAGREPLTFLRQAVDLADRHHIAIERLRRARWERMISQGCNRIGDAEGATAALGEAFSLLGSPFIKTPASMRSRLLRELLTQARHLVWSPKPSALDGDRGAQLQELIAVFRSAADRAYFEGDQLGVATWAFAIVNAAEAAGLQDDAAQGYSATAYMAAMVGLRPLAERWWRIGGRTRFAEQKLAILLSQGLTFLAECRWERLETVLQAHEAIARRASLIQLDNNFVLRIHLSFQSGHIAHAIAHANTLLDSATMHGNEQREIWARMGLESMLRMCGRFDEAQVHAERLAELGAGITDQLTTLTLRAHAIDMALVSNDLPRAIALLPEFSTAMQAKPPLSGASVLPFHTLARASVAAFAQAKALGRADAGATGRAARRDLAVLHKFARMFPIGQPSAALATGAWHWVAGQPRRARRAFEKSRRIAVARGMRVAELDAERLLALAARGRPDETRHTARADAIAREIGFELRLITLDRWQSAAGAAPLAETGSDR